MLSNSLILWFITVNNKTRCGALFCTILIRFMLSKYAYSLSSYILQLTALYPKWFFPTEFPAWNVTILCFTSTCVMTWSAHVCRLNQHNNVWQKILHKHLSICCYFIFFDLECCVRVCILSTHSLCSSLKWRHQVWFPCHTWQVCSVCNFHISSLLFL
jgi:hypothetical protein